MPPLRRLLCAPAGDQDPGEIILHPADGQIIHALFIGIAGEGEAVFPGKGENTAVGTGKAGPVPPAVGAQISGGRLPVRPAIVFGGDWDVFFGRNRHFHEKAGVGIKISGQDAGNGKHTAKAVVKQPVGMVPAGPAHQGDKAFLFRYQMQGRAYKERFFRAGDERNFIGIPGLFRLQKLFFFQKKLTDAFQGTDGGICFFFLFPDESKAGGGGAVPKKGPYILHGHGKLPQSQDDFQFGTLPYGVHPVMIFFFDGRGKEADIIIIVERSAVDAVEIGEFPYGK